MRKVIVQEWMTLDGVVQAPREKDEDRSGGFKHGGWSLPYFEDAAMTWVVAVAIAFPHARSAACGAVCRVARLLV
jgi:hypothetical protein